jgi:hypothetical protein
MKSPMKVISEIALEARARRAANRIGLRATKSRQAKDTVDNHNGFMLLDPCTNGLVDGQRFDLTADEVIERCK